MSPSKSSPKPDYRKILQVLQKKDFKPNTSVERQLATHVRTLIQSKRIAVGTRLPPIRHLAEVWDTNYFTVQAALSRLVGEGLIVQSPKKGSFVAPPRRALRRVCLYHDHFLEPDWHSEFYSQLNIWVYRLLSERQIGVVPYFDHRPPEKLHIVPPEVREMTKDGDVDGFIASRIKRDSFRWLTKLEVPFASILLDGPHAVTASNVPRFAELVVAEAVRNRRKVIGLIKVQPDLAEHGQPTFLDIFSKIAAAKGIRVVVPANTKAQDSWEKTGFQQCESLLKSKTPPDVIFVFPDTLIRGVVTSLLKHQVKIPREVQVISHRNTEMPVYLPFPLTWLTVKIEDVARALLQKLDSQISGEPFEPVEIPVAIERITGK